jgi:hypothetical protein
VKLFESEKEIGSKTLTESGRKVKDLTAKKSKLITENKQYLVRIATAKASVLRLKQQIVEHTQIAKDQLLQETESFKKCIAHLEQQASKSATSLTTTEKHVLKLTAKLNTAQKELKAKSMHTVVPAVTVTTYK